MQRILILTAGFGEGHNSAARALQAAFAERAPDCSAELVDLFSLRAPRLNALSRRGYLGLINRAPRLWSALYRWLDRSPRAPAALRLLHGHRRALGRLLEEHRPAALCSTYPVYSWLLADLRAAGQPVPPLFTVVTDALTINSLWYRAPSAAWFVTDPDSAAFLRVRGGPADRVHVSGFPVAPAFADRPAGLQPADLRPGVPRRVLFMINSGRRHALPVARALLRQAGWHVTFTAGRDAGLRRTLERLAAGSPATADILGWTDRIPELLMTHHVVISKAGGATTQEAINAHCPLIVSQVVPGQEEGNCELIRRLGAGALATTPEAIIATLEAALAGDALPWRRWRAHLQAHARPAAARTIVDHVRSHLARVALAAGPVPSRV